MRRISIEGSPGQLVPNKYRKISGAVVDWLKDQKEFAKKNEEVSNEQQGAPSFLIVGGVIVSIYLLWRLFK